MMDQFNPVSEIAQDEEELRENSIKEELRGETSIYSKTKLKQTFQ